MLNPRLKDMHDKRLTTPDLWFDDVGMAVMVHSRQFHSGALQWGHHGHRRLRPVELSHRRGRRDARAAGKRPMFRAAPDRVALRRRS